MDDEEMAVKNEDFFVTETRIDTTLPIASVVEYLQKEKIVGTLTFHLSQGNVQKAQLVERSKAPEKYRKQVRKILGV